MNEWKNDIIILAAAATTIFASSPQNRDPCYAIAAKIHDQKQQKWEQTSQEVGFWTKKQSFRHSLHINNERNG